VVVRCEILEAIPLKSEDPWADERVEQARRRIARLFARRGYLASRIDIKRPGRRIAWMPRSESRKASRLA
jgi:hypothetical protein